MDDGARAASMVDGITIGMKTAISVEDALMQEADETARNLGLSRSALIAEALREYLLRIRQARITERLNQVYKNGLEEQQLVRKLRKRIPVPERW